MEKEREKMNKSSIFKNKQLRFNAKLNVCLRIFAYSVFSLLWEYRIEICLLLIIDLREYIFFYFEK